LHDKDEVLDTLAVLAGSERFGMNIDGRMELVPRPFSARPSTVGAGRRAYFTGGDVYEVHVVELEVGLERILLYELRRSCHGALHRQPRIETIA
jgi:hypothetical protein